VFIRIVNNMFVFILCASVFLVWFSILIFALIIYIFFFIYVEKVVSFTLYIRMMVKLKDIYLTVVSFYTYKFLWNWKKYIKKIVIFYYISGYLFTLFFFYFFFYDFVVYLHFFCPYFLIYIFFLLKLLFFFFFSKFYIEFKETMERESLH
jgi:hypothetical protein